MLKSVYKQEQKERNTVMKYKVIGWTDYDDIFYDVEIGHASDAATQAIIDDIREHKYSFSGYDHQESVCCVPVLNDGKKRLYTQRGFGGLMAEAHGYRGSMDYALFSYTARDARGKKSRRGMPSLKLQFNPEGFTPEDITEDYTIEVGEEIYKQATEAGKIVIDDTPYIRFMDQGDRVTLVCGENSVTYTVHRVVKDKDLTEDDMINLYMKAQGAEEKWQNAKIIAKIYFPHFTTDND